jgi:hypothetical protein
MAKVGFGVDGLPRSKLRSTDIVYDVPLQGIDINLHLSLSIRLASEYRRITGVDDPEVVYSLPTAA